jgi:TRAP transporter 4TM/12TM fusion protein
MAEDKKPQNPDTDSGRFMTLPLAARIIFMVLTVAGIAAASCYMTNTSIFGYALPSSVYFYILYMVFLPGAFLTLPARKKDKGGLPWYDALLALLSFAIPIFFIQHNHDIVYIGWLPAPDFFSLAIAIVYSALMLEACRRIGGWMFFGVCIALGLYPLVSEQMPGFLYGMGFSLEEVVSYAIYGGEGIIGLPGKLTGGILVGFLIFAGMLLATGAGDFFIDLANCMMGRFRGGPAKVAVISSGFFGMLSGSPISNVISTGTVTIPAMKRIGYPPHLAGAIEACASTGGVLMPPVMGMIVFVMAIITEIPYSEIVMCAALPAFFYYFGLLIQVDMYAAKIGLAGLPKEEIPKVGATLRWGWQFLFVIAFLIWGLLYMRWGEVTPYYASALLFVLSYGHPRTRMNFKRIGIAIVIMGKLIAQMIALIAPFAYIIVGLVITGTSASFAAGLVGLGAGNIYLILLLGIIACYIMGIVGLDVAAYIFLAISMAPALVQLGLNKMAVHLFLVYYPMLAVITPPVAIAAFVAAAIADAPPMKTGWAAMRLGVIIYFIPIFFVLEPSLVLQGTWQATLYNSTLVILGTVVLGAGLTGYIWGIGHIPQLWRRILLGAAGVAMVMPESLTDIIGAALALTLLILQWFTNRRRVNAAPAVAPGINSAA